jgi:hypothetical protein
MYQMLILVACRTKPYGTSIENSVGLTTRNRAHLQYGTGRIYCGVPETVTVRYWYRTCRSRFSDPLTGLKMGAILRI